MSTTTRANELLDRLDELVPAIERGEPVPAWARAKVAAFLRAAQRTRARRAGGAQKARAIREEKLAAACAAHLWKTPITAPDLVERVQEHFAEDGQVAPDARFIRRWRDEQVRLISKRQHTGPGE